VGARRRSVFGDVLQASGGKEVQARSEEGGGRQAPVLAQRLQAKASGRRTASTLRRCSVALCGLGLSCASRPRLYAV